MDCKQRIREVLVQIQQNLVAGRYDQVHAACIASRLDPEAIRRTVAEYGHALTMPPDGDTTNIVFCTQLMHASVPTWAMYVHLSDQGGFHDLTLEVTASCDGDRCEIALDDLHVL